MSTVAQTCAVEGDASVVRDLPCSPLLPDDSSRNVTAQMVPAAAASTTKDDVEAALTRALVQAADAGRFDVVAQLAKELEARRLSCAGNVSRLDDQRTKRRL